MNKKEIAKAEMYQRLLVDKKEIIGSLNYALSTIRKADNHNSMPPHLLNTLLALTKLIREEVGLYLDRVDILAKFVSLMNIEADEV